MITKNKDKSPRIPKYMQLARELREQVERGERKPGEQLPTFEQMRLEHGLGQGTLERVYSLLEQEGLIVREPGKGTFVADRSRRSVGVIGLITCSNTENHHPYYIYLLEGVREAVRVAGCELLLTTEKNPVKWEKMDGLLVCSAYSANLRANLPPGMPHVSLLYATDDCSFVTTDDYGAIRQIMDHLLQLGHRRIAYLTMEKNRPMLELQHSRLKAYYDALSDAGIEIHPGWVRNLRLPFEPMQKWEILGREKMEKWLKTDWQEIGCTAIVAQNDDTAIGIIEALQDAGYKVPEDVSVAGFDGTEIARHFRPHLTTVEVPLHEMGAHGARILLEDVRRPLNGPSPQVRRTIFPIQIKVGQSTGPAKI